MRNVYGRPGDVFIQYNSGTRIIDDVQRDAGVFVEFVMLAKTFLANLYGIATSTGDFYRLCAG